MLLERLQAGRVRVGADRDPAVAVGPKSIRTRSRVMPFHPDPCSARVSVPAAVRTTSAFATPTPVPGATAGLRYFLVVMP